MSSSTFEFWQLTSLPPTVLAIWFASLNGSHQKVFKNMSKSCQKLFKNFVEWQRFCYKACKEVTIARTKGREEHWHQQRSPYLKDDILFASFWNIWYNLGNAPQEPHVGREAFFSWVTTERVHDVNYNSGWVLTVLLTFLFSKWRWRLLWIWGPSTEITKQITCQQCSKCPFVKWSPKSKSW